MITVYGAIAIEDVDNVGEKFIVEGCDIKAFNDERVVITHGFDSDPIEDALGYVTEANVFAEEPQGHWKALWNYNNAKPFVGVVARIWDQNTERLVDLKIPLYFGVGGAVLETKYDGDVRLLLKTRLNELTLTTKPAHKGYKVWPW